MPLSPGRDHQLAGFEDFAPISGEVEGWGWPSGSQAQDPLPLIVQVGFWLLLTPGLGGQDTSWSLESCCSYKDILLSFPPGLFPAPRGETEALRH